ncbi:GNAT acetyltransferase [Amphibacillus marinus]|uniref:GNAT acetyltransferase n=1 Tax=Amphibacillus marinus TaxID=872970 RepID=A0A1H8NUL3_9BACI|nr:GNAT family N-acetyltransferase [Amphibacillus marinus]SEO33212.1 GNAT acetyltransferase [Amphibacillus marinus]
MIYELEEKDFELVEPLLKGNARVPEANSIIKLNNPSRIFVDNVRVPQTALIWNKGLEGFLIAGDVNNSEFVPYLNQFIDEEIIPSARKAGINFFEISGLHYEWNPVLEETFKHRKLDKCTQLVYTWPASVKDIPGDYTNEGKVIKVTHDFLMNTKINNIEFLVSEVELYWGSIKTFLEKGGLCYCIIHEEEIASICYSAFVHRETQVIGVVTEEKHRGMGYAFQGAHALINECLQINNVPYWDCTEENTASKRLAEKLGFEKVSKYFCHYFFF